MLERETQTDLQIGSMRDRTAMALDLQLWREQLIQRILRALVFIGALTALVGSYYRFTQQRYATIVILWVAYALILFIAYNRSISYDFRIYAILFLLYGLAVQDFVVDGRAGGARLFLLMAVFVATLFMSARVGLYALVGAIALNALFAYGFLAAFFPPPKIVSSLDVGGWFSSILVLTVLGVFVITCINYLVPRLIDAMNQSGRLARELTEYQSRLEDLIAQQEIDLSLRSTQLQTAAQVAREATQFQDLDQLLDRTVHLISERFDFYHAGLFLLDEDKLYAELRAASSEGGRVMLARGHRLKVGAEGIVGYAAHHAEPRIALDVGEDAVFFDNPDLPETRSEIALPLRTREGVIGVLDVQSLEAQAFTEDDVVVLQTLADQVALVINNAQLVQQVAVQVEAERQFYQQLSRQGWEDLIMSMATPGYGRNEQGFFPAEDVWRPHMDQALRTETLTLDPQTATATVPIRVRGQVVGVIDARKPKDAGGWTQDEIELLETLSAQLDPALDSAQLYQNSQLLANRERFTREIADKMRRATDMETLARTTVEEMASVLNAARVFVQLTEPSVSEEGQ